jgi:hypothetical protein
VVDAPLEDVVDAIEVVLDGVGAADGLEQAKRTDTSNAGSTRRTARP